MAQLLEHISVSNSPHAAWMRIKNTKDENLLRTNAGIIFKESEMGQIMLSFSHRGPSHWRPLLLVRGIQTPGSSSFVLPSCRGS